MKKIFAASVLTAEIAAFAMLMLLFFLNTNKPYLLIVPVAGVIVCCFLTKRLIGKRKIIPLIAALPMIFGILIAALVIGLFRISG